MPWPVVLHDSLVNTDFGYFLKQKPLKIRVSEASVPGSVIFPVSGVAFIVLHLNELGKTEDPTNSGLSQELVERLDKFMTVHRRCYALCTAPMYTDAERNYFSLLQDKYMFTRLKLLITHNATQGVESMMTIATSLCAPMNGRLYSFMTSTISDHISADVITKLLKFIGLDSHQCEILQDTMGSLANVATATVEDLINCSLDSDTAVMVFSFFNADDDDGSHEE